MKKHDFLKKYLDSDGVVNPDILDVDDELLDIGWLPISNTVIEPDNWDLFWRLWNQEKITLRPKNYETITWQTLCIWKASYLSEEDVQKIYPQKVVDWEKHFPKMLSQIRALMPFEEIWKITLAESMNRVPAHVDLPLDPQYQMLYPWPNSVRVLLYDENKAPTFYLTQWPPYLLEEGKIKNSFSMKEWGFLEDPKAEDKCYVALPNHSNAFVYANGPLLHGSDYHGRSKILVMIWGRPSPEKWKQKLKNLKEEFPQYRDLGCLSY